jgi:uncharacterized repeat protein (TIGR03803 family)
VNCYVRKAAERQGGNMAKLNWMMKSCGVFLLWAATAVASPAQTFTTLLNFDYTDGQAPYVGLVQGAEGNYYGTTMFGGAGEIGTVFKITPTGVLTTLHSFVGIDGTYPDAALVQGTDGELYGTVEEGGAYGGGTVFKITPGGVLTTLHNFTVSDGYQPHAGLVQATDGQFYGTTTDGGEDGGGTIFKITQSGVLTTLYNFSGPDCAYSTAALIQAPDGDFYGTTSGGGANDSCTFGCGTVFKITPGGMLTTLYSFCAQSGCADGYSPDAALILASDGNFYGTTTYGAVVNNNCYEGCGTVFKITPDGTLTTLHSFVGPPMDGSYPGGALVQATDGNLYGTTSGGGTADYNYGSVFSITLGGTLTTLFSFDVDNGANPPGAMLQGTDGAFYGTTSRGGADNAGTIFILSAGLKPFVKTNPTSGQVGATVKILGTDLTGATGVMFNGTAATFTVDSHSLITTTVPAGATTGKVQVSGPGGAAFSNVPFRVN